MINGNLYIPTHIYFETYAVRNHGQELKKYGNRALIVTGKHSSRINGSLDDVINTLKANDIQFFLYDDIEENPSIETVMKAREFGIVNNVNFVIGIGGGSPLDASKAIAMMIKNKDKDSSVLYKNIDMDYIPVVAVPTTAGTGSEVTPYSILTIHEQRTKKSISHRIYPVMALVDSRYIKTQSLKGIINTAVDTLAHLIESYLNTNSNELNRIYSREGMRKFALYKDSLITGDFKDKEYDEMMLATILGGMSISHTGTSLPHGLSYMVTYETGEAHGKACGRYLGQYLKMYENNDKNETENVLNLLGFNSSDEFSDYLNKILDLKPLPQEMDEKNWEAIKSNKAKLKNYPFDVQ